MVARYLSTSTAMATFHWGRASSLVLAMAFQITYGLEPNIEIKEVKRPTIEIIDDNWRKARSTRREGRRGRLYPQPMNLREDALELD
jgi:hypothetical protein